MKVSLAEWKAWAPGINSQTDWLSYFSAQKDLSLGQQPDVSFLPPLFRRKLTPLARMVFSTVNQLENQNRLSHLPIIFGSRHGELDISIDLINSDYRETPFSPAKFSFSVHNSIVGLLSIHYQNNAPNNAIAAGKKTLEMSLLEAQNTLLDYDDCLMIYADSPLAEVYENYKDENDFPVCLVIYLNKKFPLQHLSFKANQEFAVKSIVSQLCQINLIK